MAGGEFTGANPYAYLPSTLLFVLLPATLWYLIVRRSIYQIMVQAYGDGTLLTPDACTLKVTACEEGTAEEVMDDANDEVK